MPVFVGGKHFASAHEAATHFGVSVSHIYVTLCRGNPDTVGKGKGYKPPGNPNYGGGRSKRLKLGRHTFPSVAAAARAMGWLPDRLERVLRQRGPIQMERLYAALLELDLKVEVKDE